MAVISTEEPSQFETRCTIKISYNVGEDSEQDIILVIKAIFKYIKKYTDKKLLILPWFDADDKDNEPITILLQIP